MPRMPARHVSYMYVSYLASCGIPSPFTYPSTNPKCVGRQVTFENGNKTVETLLGIGVLFSQLSFKPSGTSIRAMLVELRVSRVPMS